MVLIKRMGIVSVLTVILAVLCVAAPAMAATWVVNPDGTGDFTTIQAAFDSKWTSGDTIEIAYAVYQEPVAVDAGGRDLTIAGVPSPAGELPVIDGMDGAVELPGLDQGSYGCGACSMYLFDGNFIVSNLLVTNASNNGMVVHSGDVVQITEVEAAENGRHGINIIGYDGAVLTGIAAYNNGWAGIHTRSTDYVEGTDLFCYDNNDDGLQICGSDEVYLSFVEATGNGWRGVNVQLRESSTALISDILVTDNRNDGLFVKGSGLSTADISRVESTGNGGDGVVLNGFDTFTASGLFLDGNGEEQDLDLAPLLHADCRNAAIGNGEECSGMSTLHADCDTAVMTNSVASDLRGEGNGLFVVKCVDGLIDDVEATNNPSVGILVDATGDVVISNCTADANGYLGILTMSLSDEFSVPMGGLLSDTSMDMESGATENTFETAFTGMTASVADATVVSEDEFILGEGVSIFVEDIIEEGPDVTLSSVTANNNGYAGIGVIAPYVIASDITANENGACPTDTAGTLTGAGIVGASFVGEYSDITAADNGGAGMAAASLALDIDDSLFTGNGVDAYSDIHGPLFQTGLLTVSAVNTFSGVHSDRNAGSGMLMTSVITDCDGCTASGNEYAGIVAADPLSLGIAAAIVHFGPSFISEADGLSEEDRFYLTGLSSQTMQDVVTCYGTTDTFVPSAVADTGMDSISDEDIAFLVDLLHQYLAISECVITDSAADENGLFGMAVVYPNVMTDGFSADGNGYDGAEFPEALAGTGIAGLYMTGEFIDTSVSENTGAGMVTIGVVSAYVGVIADDNGYAGIVTIDPLTLAAAFVGYFVVLDDTDTVVSMTTDTTDLDMHADIAESAVVQEIIATYYIGTPSEGITMDAVSIPDDGMDILLEHIELYFDYAGVYAYDVSASGNGYPGFVAIAPNVVMDGVTADHNGAKNDDESDVIGLAAGSGIVGLSIAGEYTDIAANGNSGAGIAAAGVVTDMTACEADDNDVGVVSLFIAGDYAEICADENALSGIVLAGINGTLTDSAAAENAGPGIVCVDPVAAALMYLVFTPEAEPAVMVGSTNGMDASFEYETDAVSPETFALLSQLSGSTDTVSSVSDDSETETAWTLIEWGIAHISSYEGDVTELNETEILDLVLTHYLTGAGLSVSDVTADNNGWQGIVVLSPSIAVADVAADGNGYHGVSVISPWKAVDATGFVHPAEPVGAERLSVRDIYTVSNGGAGLAVSGANGGDVMDVYGSDNSVGILLGDSDHLMVSDNTFETNVIASVFCGGSQVNSLVPTGVFLSNDILTDPTGSSDNVFAYTDVDAGIVILPNSSGNVFDDTFLDEAGLIAADISGDGPFVVYSTSGSWAPALPDPQPWHHMGGCGIGVVGLGGFNTTVNVTYDYSYGFPPVTGAGLYPQWAENATTPWKDWQFNAVTNDPVTMTVGTMQVPINLAGDTYGVFSDVMFLAPFWTEERGGDDPSREITGNTTSLSASTPGPLSGIGTSVVKQVTGDVPGAESGDGSDDDTGTPETTPVADAGTDLTSAPAAGEATATGTEAVSTPVPTTTPAGTIPAIGALGILGAIALLRRR